MSLPIWGSLSLKNNSYLELFNAANTFSLQLQAGSATSNGVLTLPDTTDTLTANAATQTLTNKTMSGASNTFSAISLTTAVTGTLPLANGGTNATSAAAAYNNLSPMTTTGDLEYEASASTAARLAIGTTGQVLTVVSGLPAWATLPAGGTVTSVAASGGTTGLTFSGSPITTSGTLTLGGTLAIANGGTGQATQTAAFDALSPLTTAGDVLYYNGTHNVRLAVGTTGQVLTVAAGEPSWSTPTSSPVSTFKNTWITADGASKAITHSLGTTDVTCEIYDISSGATIGVDSVVRTSTSVLTVTASSAPPATSWRVLITALN